jgi:hypothetical protein
VSYGALVGVLGCVGFFALVLILAWAACRVAMDADEIAREHFAKTRRYEERPDCERRPR